MKISGKIWWITNMKKTTDIKYIRLFTLKKKLTNLTM